MDATMPNEIITNAQTHTHTPLWSVYTRFCIHTLPVYTRFCILGYIIPSYWKRNTHSITHPSLQIWSRDNTTLPTPDHLAKVRPLINKSMSVQQRLGSDVRFRADLQPDSMEAIPFWFCQQCHCQQCHNNLRPGSSSQDQYLTLCLNYILLM